MVRIFLFFIVVLTLSLIGCSERQVLEGKESNHYLLSSKLELSISTDDKLLLEKLVEVEAGEEPYIGQVAIASIVFNRMKHPNFPNQITDVILQINPSVLEGEMNVSDISRRAVQDAINGWDPSGGALYYFKTAPGNSKLKAIKKIGNITFYK